MRGYREVGMQICREAREVALDEGRVGAIFNIGVTGTDAIIKVVDDWTLPDGKAISLWAAYFEPQAVLEALGIENASVVDPHVGCILSRACR